MKNYVPHYIINKFSEKVYHKEIYASTMFIDISGFTPLTDELTKHGRAGAEKLSDVINNIFNPMLESIHRRGGFVSVFAGDAMTIVFPENDKPLNIIYTAFEINDLFEREHRTVTDYGVFDIRCKIGLSCGKAEWGIVGSDEHKTFYFKGEAIDGCAKSEHKAEKMDIIIDDKLLDTFDDGVLEYDELDGKHSKLVRVNVDEDQKLEYKPIEHDIELLKPFVPNLLLEEQLSGELKETVNIFISFKSLDRNHKTLNDFVAKVISDVDRWGGYFNKIDFGDKGGVILINFGIPNSYENNIQRALNCMLAIKRSYRRKIRAGVTIGAVFTGVIGNDDRCAYDVLGDSVNLSARLMMEAKWGKVWLSKDVADKGKGRFIMDLLGEVTFKGKKGTLQTFELLDKKQFDASTFYRGKMYGRGEEVKTLKGYIEPISKGQFGGVVYLYGEAGIGKSRLVFEVASSYDDEFRTCVLQCDSILKKSMNPFQHFVSSFFNQYEARSESEKEDNFADVFEELLEQLENVKERPYPILPLIGEGNSKNSGGEENNNKASEVSPMRGDLEGSLQVSPMRGDLEGSLQKIIDELERTEPFIKAMLMLDVEGTLYEEVEPKLKYENTIIALKMLFKGLSLIQPTVILLEDLHWIDSDSQEMMLNLTRNVDDFPFIVIATSRYNDDGSKPVLKCDKKVSQNEIAVNPVNVASVKDIIKQWLGYYPDASLLNFIQDRTENNPFYVEQFCLYLMEQDCLDLKDERYHLTTTPAEIPSNISDIVVARIDRLSAELKELVQTASVLGREFDMNILREMLSILNDFIETYKLSGQNLFNIRAILTMLDKDKVVELIEDGMKESLWDSVDELRYMFKHSLLMTAAYDMQLRSKVKNLHRIAGESMEKVYGKNKVLLKEHYKDIAYQFEKAEFTDRALIYYKKAGDYLKEKYKSNDALSMYDKILEIGVDKAEEVDIIQNKADILDLIGKWDEAIELLNKGIEIAETLPKRPHPILPLIGEGIGKSLGEGDLHPILPPDEEEGNSKSADKEEKEGESLQVSPMSGDLEGSLQEEEGNSKSAGKEEKEGESLQVSPMSGDLEGSLPSPLGELKRSLGWILKNKGKYEEAMFLFEEAKTLAEEVGDRSLYSKALGNIGNVYLMKDDDYDNAIRCYEEDKQICEELGDRKGYSIVIINMGVVYTYKGDYDNGMRCFKEYQQICEELGDRKGYLANLLNMGVVYMDKGDYDEAMYCYNKATRIAKELGDRLVYSKVLGNIGIVYMDKGDYDKAMYCYNKAKQTFQELGGKMSYSVMLDNIGVVYAYKGDYDNAIQSYDEAINIGRELGFKLHLGDCLNNKAKALFETGKVAEAKLLNDEALQIAKEVSRYEYIFEATVLKYKIASVNDKASAVSGLEGMLGVRDLHPILPPDEEEGNSKSSGSEEDKGKASEVSPIRGDLEGSPLTDEQVATIHYELWKLTGDDTHRDKAVDMYRALYENKPKYEFRQRMEEMEG